MVTEANKKAFIDRIAEYVKKYAPEYGITVYSPIIAQACLESGYGTSNKVSGGRNNYFGLKYRPNRCPTSNGTFTEIGSEQNADGSYTQKKMTWFKFPDMEACVKGYFDFTNISTYKNLKGVTDPQTYLELIKEDKYCTSLNYVKNVMQVVKDNKLTNYDSTPTVAPAKKTLYKVQVGAFSVKSNADKLAKELKSKGYQTMVVEVEQ